MSHNTTWSKKPRSCGSKNYAVTIQSSKVLWNKVYWCTIITFSRNFNTIVSGIPKSELLYDHKRLCIPRIHAFLLEWTQLNRNGRFPHIAVVTLHRLYNSHSFRPSDRHLQMSDSCSLFLYYGTYYRTFLESIPLNTLLLKKKLNCWMKSIFYFLNIF